MQTVDIFQARRYPETRIQGDFSRLFYKEGGSIASLMGTLRHENGDSPTDDDYEDYKENARFVVSIPKNFLADIVVVANIAYGDFIILYPSTDGNVYELYRSYGFNYTDARNTVLGSSEKFRKINSVRFEGKGSYLLDKEQIIPMLGFPSSSPDMLMYNLKVNEHVIGFKHMASLLPKSQRYAFEPEYQHIPHPHGTFIISLYLDNEIYLSMVKYDAATGVINYPF